jgi:hypothetical protein
MFQFDGSYLVPGLQSVLATVENQFWWDRYERQVWSPQVIDGSARDSGNTSYTDVLRPGLLLGKITATGKLKEWSPTATDGSQLIWGVLGYAQKMQRNGANADRWMGQILLSGALKANRILVPGQTAFGISGLSTEFTIRKQLHSRFLFDDMPWGVEGGWREIRELTSTTYQVLSTDHNVLFTNRGNAGNLAITLPATPYKHFRVGVYCIAAGTVTVASGTADTLIVGNDATADSIACSQANEIIGNHLEFIGDGTGWMTINHIALEAFTNAIVTA